MSQEQELTPLQMHQEGESSPFSKEHVNYDLDEARNYIRRPLNPRWIQQRTQGNTTLSYIGGHVVIHLLNNAFNYQWTFEVLSKNIIPSAPKPKVEWQNRKRVAVKDKDGNPVMEAQPPYVEVLGRLTVPGLGFREQYGSKIIIGGATEQEHATKSAATDALKKCASLFGIGLELYGEADGLMDMDQAPHEDAEYLPVEETVRPKQQQPVQAPPAHHEAAPEAPQQSNLDQPAPTRQPSFGFDQADTKRIVELKMELGKLKGLDGPIQNPDLNPYLQEMTGDETATFHIINPQNIKDIIAFLENKIQSMKGA